MQPPCPIPVDPSPPGPLVPPPAPPAPPPSPDRAIDQGSGWRLPCPVPEREQTTRFALLLRHLAVLQGWSAIRALEAERVQALLDRFASAEADQRALGAFEPLVARGFLALLDADGADRRERAQRLAGQVTIRPEQLERIAARIAPLVTITSEPAMEALALAQATRAAASQPPRIYHPILLWVVLGVVGAAAAVLALLVQGARRTLLERATPAASPAPVHSLPPAGPAAPLPPAR